MKSVLCCLKVPATQEPCAGSTLGWFSCFGKAGPAASCLVLCAGRIPKACLPFHVATLSQQTFAVLHGPDVPLASWPRQLSPETWGESPQVTQCWWQGSCWPGLCFGSAVGALVCGLHMAAGVGRQLRRLGTFQRTRWPEVTAQGDWRPRVQYLETGTWQRCEW